MEDFVVKQYIDERTTIKGNGFDGLEVGDTREEAQEFVDFVNKNKYKLETELKAIRKFLHDEYPTILEQYLKEGE